MQIETVEDNGDITTYTLKDHKENKKIKDDIFAFETPKGTDVIDRQYRCVVLSRCAEFSR